jgi:hypothetical protein
MVGICRKPARPLGRYRPVYEDTVETDSTETGYTGVDLIHLTHDTDPRLASTNTEIKTRDP